MVYPWKQGFIMESLVALYQHVAATDSSCGHGSTTNTWEWVLLICTRVNLRSGWSWIEFLAFLDIRTQGSFKKVFSSNIISIYNNWNVNQSRIHPLTASFLLFWCLCCSCCFFQPCCKSSESAPCKYSVQMCVHQEYCQRPQLSFSKH